MITTNTYIKHLLNQEDVNQLFAHCIEYDEIETIYIQDIIQNKKWYTKVIVRCEKSFIPEIECILNCY